MRAVCSLDPRVRRHVLDERNRLAEGLRRDSSIASVYAFGSFARETEHEESDIAACGESRVSAESGEAPFL